MNTTWYLFRHALATYSTEGYGGEIFTAEILPEAIPPIRRLAKYLKRIGPGAQYVSEFKRCRQTAAIVTDITGKRFTVEPRINEFYAEETGAFIARVREWVSEAGTTETENVIACTHGAVIAAIRHILTDNILDERNLLDYVQCGQLMVIENGTVRTVDFNTDKTGNPDDTILP